jgi:hypothetical protein
MRSGRYFFASSIGTTFSGEQRHPVGGKRGFCHHAPHQAGQRKAEAGTFRYLHFETSSFGGEATPKRQNKTPRDRFLVARGSKHVRTATAFSSEVGIGSREENVPKHRQCELISAAASAPRS